MNYSYTMSGLPAETMKAFISRPPVTPVDRELEIQTMEWFVEYKNERRTDSRRQNFVEILWIRSGSGTLQVNCQDYPVKNNIVYCISPGQQRILYADGVIEGLYLQVSVELMHNFSAESNSPFTFRPNHGWSAPLILDIDESMELAEEILLKMRKVLQNYSLQDTEIVRGYLKIFLLYISRNTGVQYNNAGYSRDAEIVQEFLALVKQHFITKKMVAQYASELCVTAAYLNRIVKKVSGFTASYHIQQFVIFEAKRLARHSRKSMKEIAYGLGFNDIAHFSKFFKNYTGQNFSSFKRGYLLPAGDAVLKEAI